MQKMPATTPVMKLMTGRTTAATGPKNAWVTRMESAPVSGAVIRKDMHADRDAPLRRISATTGTTEQLQSGIGTPMAALDETDFRLSRRNHFKIACREMNTWITPARNSPRRSIGASRRNDDQRKSRNRTSSSMTLPRSPPNDGVLFTMNEALSNLCHFAQDSVSLEAIWFAKTATL